MVFNESIELKDRDCTKGAIMSVSETSLLRDGAPHVGPTSYFRFRETSRVYLLRIILGRRKTLQIFFFSY